MLGHMVRTTCLRLICPVDKPLFGHRALPERVAPDGTPVSCWVNTGCNTPFRTNRNHPSAPELITHRDRFHLAARSGGATGKIFSSPVRSHSRPNALHVQGNGVPCRGVGRRLAGSASSGRRGDRPNQMRKSSPVGRVCVSTELSTIGQHMLYLPRLESVSLPLHRANLRTA